MNIYREKFHGGLGLPGRSLPISENPRSQDERRNHQIMTPDTKPDIRPSTIIAQRAQNLEGTVSDLRPLLSGISPQALRRIKRAEGVKYMGQ